MKREQLEAAGQWLRRARVTRGYATLVDFARALDIDQSQVSRYERGVSEISDERAAQIARVLGMDLIEVRRNLGLWVPDDAQPEGGPNDAVMTALARELMAQSQRLNELAERILGRDHSGEHKTG